MTRARAFLFIIDERGTNQVGIGIPPGAQQILIKQLVLVVIFSLGQSHFLLLDL